MIANTVITPSGCHVIPFPKDRIKRDFSLEGFKDKLAEQKIEFIAYMVDKHVNALLNRLSMEGVEVGGTEGIADFAFIFEVVRSALYRVYNMQHPIQEFVDMNFTNLVKEAIDDIAEHFNDGEEE